YFLAMMCPCATDCATRQGAESGIFRTMAVRTTGQGRHVGIAQKYGRERSRPFFVCFLLTVLYRKGAFVSRRNSRHPVHRKSLVNPDLVIRPPAGELSLCCG